MAQKKLASAWIWAQDLRFYCPLLYHLCFLIAYSKIHSSHRKKIWYTIDLSLIYVISEASVELELRCIRATATEKWTWPCYSSPSVSFSSFVTISGSTWLFRSVFFYAYNVPGNYDYGKIQQSIKTWKNSLESASSSIPIEEKKKLVCVCAHKQKLHCWDFTAFLCFMLGPEKLLGLIVRAFF